MRHLPVEVLEVVRDLAGEVGLVPDFGWHLFRNAGGGRRVHVESGGGGVWARRAPPVA